MQETAVALTHHKAPIQIPDIPIVYISEVCEQPIVVRRLAHQHITQHDGVCDQQPCTHQPPLVVALTGIDDEGSKAAACLVLKKTQCQSRVSDLHC